MPFCSANYMHTEDYNSLTISHQCNLCMWLSFILNVNKCLLFTAKTSLWTRELKWIGFQIVDNDIYSIENLRTMQPPSIRPKTTANIYFIHIIYSMNVILRRWPTRLICISSHQFFETNRTLCLFLENFGAQILHFRLPFSNPSRLIHILSGAFSSFVCFHVFSSQAIL